MIQSHAPVTLGNSGTPNLPGLWAVLIPEVTETSVWVLSYMSIVSNAPSGTVGNSLNLELAVGPTGQEIRRWKSFLNISGGGGTLEYDDSWWSKYIPFNFRKGVQISGRIAAISASFGVKADIQLQLYS